MTKPRPQLYKPAAALLLIQGIFMELGIFVAVMALSLAGVPVFENTGKYVSFALPYLQENLHLFVYMAGIFGALRVVGAVGLLKNRMWGFVLSLINIIVTLALMLFMLPAGIFDGLLSGGALVLLLIGYFGDRPIGK